MVTFENVPKLQARSVTEQRLGAKHLEFSEFHSETLRCHRSGMLSQVLLPASLTETPLAALLLKNLFSQHDDPHEGAAGGGDRRRRDRRHVRIFPRAQRVACHGARSGTIRLGMLACKLRS